MVNNIAKLEAYIWLESFSSLLPPLQYSKLESLILSNPKWLQRAKNWKKKLLESFSDSSGIELWGNKIQFVNLNDARAMLDEIWIKDIYGLKCSKPLKKVIDAGASSEFFTLSLLKTHQDCKVICKEPNPLNIELISNNLKPYLANSQVELIDKALSGDEKGTILNIPIDVKKFGGMGASTQNRIRGMSRESKALEIVTITLDNLLNKEVCLLKCDIEGAEFDTLLAAGKNIKNCKNVIVKIHTDVSDFTEKFVKLLSFLKLNCFQVFCYEGATSPCSFYEKSITPSFLLFAKNEKTN